MTHLWKIWAAADPGSPATQPDGLTQPWATVIAATIAILGALFAFLGVTKTTRTTRKENRRSEKVRVLDDAWTAAVKYSRALERLNKIDAPGERATEITKMAAGPMWDLSDEYVVAVTKLPIYNFGVAFAAVSKLHASEIKIWESLRANPLEKVDETRATQLYKEAERAIKYSLEALG